MPLRFFESGVRRFTMLGAIIGDIVGSVYECSPIKTKDFPLFREDCFFTDDTVMSMATADGLMRGGRAGDFREAYKKWGRLYPDVGYGERFFRWIHSVETQAYSSWGNGSAMRVSPCAWLMDCGFYAQTGKWPVYGRREARISAEVTHNHPEAIKGALAVTDAIFLCRFYTGRYSQKTDYPAEGSASCKRLIKEHLEGTYGYNLSKSLDEIRPNYRFTVRCQDTVPQAITAFLESTDFEEAIRNAISLGGDSDTLAAITGSIAEAAYGIPAELGVRALSYLDEPLRLFYAQWLSFLKGAGRPDPL